GGSARRGGACGAAGGGGATSSRVAEVGEGELLEQRERAERHQRRQRLVRVLELGSEGLAARARPQVAANERAWAAQQPLGHLAELDPDLLTGKKPRFGGFGKGDTRTHEQRLYAGNRRFHRLGDLVVGQGVHLSEDER